MAHDSHRSPYFAVFIALCICTALSAAADVFDVRGMFGYLGLVVIVFAVAVAKALFVMSYFMHLKFEGRWKFVLLAPTVILAIGLPLALLPDIGVHYYIDESPQKKMLPHHATGAHDDGGQAADVGHH